MEKFYEDFLEKGYFIHNVENIEFLNVLKTKLQEKLSCEKLENIHNDISIDNINKKRINCFREINKIKDWEQGFFSISSSKIRNLLGPDISIQSKLNLSIQMPGDSSSVLNLHTDALSGQSVFEIVLWLPLTSAFETNSMYIFSKEKTNEILDELQNSETIGMKKIFEKYKEHANYLKLNFGECLIFSPTLFHGNTLNQTNVTRISINCRFKNLFSHEQKNGERRLGSFYKVLNISPVTKIGLEYRQDLINFL